ncbi:MAG: SIMPL domain-containing protein [Pseudomonadota bacterium]
MNFPGMRRTIIAAVCVFLATGTALAQTVNAEPTPRIIVSGTGTADIAPDMAVLTLSVLRQAETARAALDANNQAMAAVLDAMRAEGIEDRDLQTANFRINPRFERPSSSNSQRRDPVIIGYDVYNTLTVRVRDLDSLGAVIDRSVTLGANSGGNIQFTNDDPSAAIEQARIKAMQEALRKAETLSSTAGVGLGPILQISEQSSQPRPVPFARAEMAVVADAAVPIATGENSYSVTVNVTIALDQP